MIIFDLDGTLSIVGDRLKYLNQDKPDWDSFYEACDEDLVNEPIATVFRSLEKSNKWIKIVTGRKESVREKTLDWLDKNHLYIEDEDLHMRSNDDERHDIYVKPELMADFIDQVEMIFEDRNSMVKKWRELGITCLQVADGDF